MTSKERLLTVFRGKKPDRIPWAPLIDGYFTISLKKKGIDMSVVEALRYIGADILERHVPTYTDILQMGASYMLDVGKGALTQGNVKVSTKLDKKTGELFAKYETPVGILNEKYLYTESSPYLPFPIESKIKKKEDLKIYKYLLENIKHKPCIDEFQTEADYIGNDGLATASGPSTPLLRVVQREIGVERFYYFLYDYPKDVEEILDIMHERNKAIYRTIIASPSEVIIDHENTSTTLHSPKIYERYCLTQINDYADIVHSAGKIFLTHMCGTLNNLMELIDRGKMDGITDVAIPPTGDLDLSKALKVWGKNKVVMGGIDATAFTQLSIRGIKEYTRDMLRKVIPGDNFILGSADATPYGTPVENLRAVTEVVEKDGRYPLCL